MSDKKDNKHKIGELVFNHGLLGQITRQVNDLVYEIYWFHDNEQGRRAYGAVEITRFKDNLNAHIVVRRYKKLWDIK